MSSVAPPAAEVAYLHVKDALLTGRLHGGEMVSEGDVAGELAMSRTPVREAFLRLAAEGWLRLFPKRGALVVPVAPGEAEAVVDARLLLESHAVETVVAGPPAARERLVTTLRHLVDAQRAAIGAGDLDAYADHDAAFHQAIVASGGNVLLTDFAVALRERQRRMIALSVGAGGERAPAFMEGHDDLVAAIDAGDAPGFRARLAAHLHSAHLGSGPGDGRGGGPGAGSATPGAGATWSGR